MYISLDVHKDNCVGAAINENGETVEKFEIATSMQAIDNWARKISKDAKIVMETSTASIPIYNHLRKMGFEVHMANPKKVRQIAEASIKNDDRDTQVLAHLLRLGYLPESYVPDEETSSIRTLVSHRVSLGQKITVAKNQIHALLTKNCISHGFSDLFGMHGIRFLQKQKLPLFEQAVLDSLLREIGHLSEEIIDIDTRLAQIANKNNNAKLLMTIRGIGYYSAVGVCAMVGDIKRFPNHKKFTSYIGLVPRLHQTGKTKYYGRITKEGPSILRWILISDAHSIIRGKNDTKLKRFYQRLRRRKVEKKKAIVAVARKLAIIIYHILLDEKEYEEREDDLVYRKIASMQLAAKRETPKDVTRWTHLRNIGIENLITEGGV